VGKSKSPIFASVGAADAPVAVVAASAMAASNDPISLRVGITRMNGWESEKFS